nr:hypothetical protein [uncultured bacterium]
MIFLSSFLSSFSSILSALIDFIIFIFLSFSDFFFFSIDWIVSVIFFFFHS